MNDLEARIYPHLPIFMQNMACNLHGWQQRQLRYGNQFQEMLSWLNESQWWAYDKIEAYQEDQLQELIEYSYENVPYYRRLFDEKGVNPQNISSRHDLAQLPVLTKEEVHENLPRLISKQFKEKDLIHSHTSGTSGKSLHFYMEPSAFQFRWAVWWRHKMRFDITFDAPYATFTGLNVVPLNQARPPFWRENWLMKQTVFTMHHIVPEKVEAIAVRLSKGGFEYYAGYPSVLYVLADLIIEKNLKIQNPPKIIFTGAENLYEYQRQRIAEAFQCPVTDQYGFSEGCGNASRCEHDLFHEDFEYGILECGDPVTIDENTIQGKIIATGFASRGMPFIRYEVGDIGVWQLQECACGRKTRVLQKVVGRVEDYVVTPEGSRIMRFDYIFKDTINVKEAQVVQEIPGTIKLRIVQRPGYSRADELLLEREVFERVSPKLNVEFEYVPEIEREVNGKFRAVKSYLHQN